jgi:hypothetical protein
LGFGGIAFAWVKNDSGFFDFIKSLCNAQTPNYMVTQSPNFSRILEESQGLTIGAFKSSGTRQF